MRGITLPDFKSYYKDKIIMPPGTTSGQIGQWKQIVQNDPMTLTKVSMEFIVGNENLFKIFYQIKCISIWKKTEP